MHLFLEGNSPFLKKASCLRKSLLRFLSLIIVRRRALFWIVRRLRGTQRTAAALGDNCFSSSPVAGSGNGVRRLYYSVRLLCFFNASYPRQGREEGKRASPLPNIIAAAVRSTLNERTASSGAGAAHPSSSSSLPALIPIFLPSSPLQTFGLLTCQKAPPLPTAPQPVCIFFGLGPDAPCRKVQQRPLFLTAVPIISSLIEGGENRECLFWEKQD